MELHRAAEPHHADRATSGSSANHPVRLLPFAQAALAATTLSCPAGSQLLSSARGAVLVDAERVVGRSSRAIVPCFATWSCTPIALESRVGPGRSRVGCVRNATDRRPLLPPDVRISRIRRFGRIHRRAHAAC